jgi:hypothetical protein
VRTIAAFPMGVGLAARGAGIACDGGGVEAWGGRQPEITVLAMATRTPTIETPAITPEATGTT